MDLSTTTAPDSTQINAEDLLAGPVTVTITAVRGGTAEQPVNIDLAEYPDRAYRPGKSMRRVLVAAWGADSAAYIGRRLTLYRDAEVRFGGLATGGVRISHMSHIAKPLTLALMVTRGRRAVHVVEPLPDAPAPTNTAPAPLLAKMRAVMADAGITAKDDALAYLSKVAGRPVTSSNELTTDEAEAVLDALMQAGEPEPAADEPTEALWPETPEVPK